MVFQRFYTYPPTECEWSWILRNIKQKPQPHAVHEIVDVGILDLKTPPYKHTEDKIKLWEKTKTTGWKVVFDCFDLKGEFGINDHGFDTVEYSKELFEQFYNGEPDLMPVIQGYSDSSTSFIEYADWIYTKYNSPNILGVSGSVGRNKDKDLVYRVLKHVRRKFPESWIHVFALHRNHFYNVHNLIDSFDSSNWTFPRESGRSSCKNKVERIEFFWDYVNGLNLPYNKGGQEVLTCL